MLSEQRHANNGRITKGIEVDASVLSVLDFVKINLSVFVKKNKGAVSMNENGLTQKLCILLNRIKDKEPFFFQPEDMEDKNRGNSPKIDVGVFSDKEKITVYDTTYGEDDSFFKIEAKRLAKISVAREKEYVIGRMGQDKYLETGGIERFKKGIHGKNLRHAAIIGYIQNEDFDYWFNLINSWITELITQKGNFWQEEDKLIKANQGFESGLVLNSTNFRAKPNSKPDYIHLTHFWVDLK